LDKIVEEAQELREVQNETERFEEFGDLLFVMVNLGRHMGLDPESALRAANAKFTRRFESIEAALSAQGRTPKDSDLAEMDALWDAAKAMEKQA
jgi:ATP diphosphatase